jgi:glycolate oxidase FAD binding subunit
MAAASPSAGLRPSSTAELAALLGADSRPLEPLGYGSKRAIGRPIEAEPLDLSALTGVVDYRPAELVLTANAATPLAEIEALLADNGQRLAFEPPDLGPLLGTTARRSKDPVSGTQSKDPVSGTQSRQSIGGVLAANLSGSRRISAGAARDHFLGVTAVNGRGETFRAGGKVVKNVTGYDLPKLLAGSWGSLAVMTELTLKVVPQAETELTLIVPDVEPREAVATLCAALGSAHEVSSAAFDPWRGSAIRLEGIAASVAARRSALLEALGGPEVEELDAGASRDFWRRTAGAGALADWAVIWRISVPPSDAPRVVEAIAPERYLLDWGGSLIWAAYDRVDSPAVRGALRDGHAMLLKAPADSRTCRRHPPSAAMADVLDRLRRAFDPDGRLNPGRMD